MNSIKMKQGRMERELSVLLTRKNGFSERIISPSVKGDDRNLKIVYFYSPLNKRTAVIKENCRICRKL